MESQMNDEVIVYYTITVAAHVSITERRITRVVELREEIHPAPDDPPMLQTTSTLVNCGPAIAEVARSIAEQEPWPAVWEFGY